MPLYLKTKISNLFSDERFSEILTGSVFTLIARVVGTGAAFIVSLLVARLYGAEMVGVLAIVQAFILLVSIFCLLGTNVSILRLIPEYITKYSMTSAFYIYRKAQGLVLSVSLLLGLTIVYGADIIAERILIKPQYSMYIALAGFCLLFRALMDFNAEAVRGLQLIRTYAFMQILPHASMLLILILLAFFSGNVNDPVHAQLGAWGVTAGVGVIVLNRAFRKRIKPKDLVKKLPLRKLLAISTPMFLTASMNFLIGQVGVLILGMYRSASEVGYYAIAVKLATLTTFILQAINSMAAPKFSELFYSKRIDDLFYIAKKSTKLIFWTTTPVLLFLVLFGKYILSMFGPEFVIAYVPMLILMVGQFVNSVSGSTLYFMNMTGNQRKFKNFIVVASILNIVLCFILSPSLGAIGVAVAGSCSLITWNILTLLYMKHKFGTTICFIPFKKIRPFSK